MSTATSSVRATTLPSPSIPSPSSIATSSNASSLSTPNSLQQPYEDLDQKIADLKRQWTAGGGHQGPDLMYNCVEYVTFNPRSWGFKDRSSQHEKSPSFGKNEWTVPPMPPVLSGWAAGMQFGHVSGQKGDSKFSSSNYPSSAPNGRNSHTNPTPRNPVETFNQVPPTPPLEEIRKSIEIFQGLPSMMSPTIPSWPAPARRVTGGKQPGKVPKAPLGMGVTSEEGSDSGSDSDRSSSDAESDKGVMSDSDAHTRSRKGIGYGRNNLSSAFFHFTSALWTCPLIIA
ncbi:hypothetical protein EDD21DRAFT_150012 [Dissophora ornata]|nr:hypothetical protein EDD21DRAFT_150012 [Dissophora ornata]